VPDGLVVFADAGLLRRILQNLLANAITYTPRGEVRIIARVVPGDESVECLVSDNGSGVAPELLPTLFDKGTTDPASDQGTGLGLAIVKAVTEAHGGTVTVESVVGEGSTFRIVLPAAPPKS
jgi:signal transduction histidine kinase